MDDTLLPAINNELVGNGESLLTQLSALQPSATGPCASASFSGVRRDGGIEQARQQVLNQINLFFSNPSYNFLTTPVATPSAPATASRRRPRPP